MIVYHHLIVHARGLGLLGGNNFQITNHTISDGLLDSFLIMTVNCFIFISGYYGFKFRIKTVINLFVQAFTYSILLNLFYDYFFASINLSTFFTSLFPVFKGYWWFITTYIFLYMLSPLLNLVRQKLNKFQFLYIVSVLTGINYFISFIWGVPNLGVNKGYSAISFITIYFYGYALKEYFILSKSKYFYIAIYGLSSLFIFLMFMIGLKYFSPITAYKAFSYNNPFVLISAISFFFIFKEIKVKSDTILKVAPIVLGVYLIHDHKKIRLLLGKICGTIEAHGLNMYVSLLILSLSIFILAAIIEWIRGRLTAPVVSTIIETFNLNTFDDKINNPYSTNKL
jgi:hypothetical protein